MSKGMRLGRKHMKFQILLILFLVFLISALTMFNWNTDAVSDFMNSNISKYNAISQQIANFLTPAGNLLREFSTGILSIIVFGIIFFLLFQHLIKRFLSPQ